MFKVSYADLKFFPLHATIPSLIMFLIGTDMMHVLEKLHNGFRGTAVAFITIIFLFFPCSSYILCIAPGDHIEIEDINATCCPPSDISIPDGYHSNNRFNPSGNCQNCTDYFITANRREAVLKSCDHTATNPFAEECLENQLSANIPLSPCRPSVFNNINTSILVSSSIPLRC